MICVTIKSIEVIHEYFKKYYKYIQCSSQSSLLAFGRDGRVSRNSNPEAAFLAIFNAIRILLIGDSFPAL